MKESSGDKKQSKSKAISESKMKSPISNMKKKN